MKKTLLVIVLLFSISLSVFFLGHIVLKEYFNQTYYYTPNLINTNIEEANNLIENSPLKILEASQEFSQAKAGDIFMQEPRPGSVVKKGRIIRVWVSKGTQDKVVPDVSGLSYLDAKSIIESNGFPIGQTSTVSLNLPVGTVIATDPAANSTASKEQAVNFLVNKESNVSSTRMPDLIGLSLDDSKAILKDNSLILGDVTYEKYEGIDPGIVVETSIEVNTSLQPGSSINLKISK